jgi:uncharacterized protein YbjT (DUF2867 family)
MTNEKSKRVLITGGDTSLGIHIASALLAAGAEVTLLVSEGHEARLGGLAKRVQVQVADVWDLAALKGRARGHGTVIHTVGSMIEDRAQGLSFQRLNVVSARNVANMCVSDGVQHFVLMSAVRAPWIKSKYIAAKREAEAYMRRLGLKTSVIRAPISYVRGTKRPFFFQLMTALGSIPPLSWTHLGRMAPMPIDMLARGVAHLALNPPSQTKVYYAGHLRRLNKRDEVRGNVAKVEAEAQEKTLPFE